MFQRSSIHDIGINVAIAIGRFYLMITKLFATFRLHVYLSHLKKYLLLYFNYSLKGFPGGSVVKNQPARARDMSSIPGLGTCPGEGNGNPLQYSCLQNPKDREAWQATVHEAAKESDET